MAELTSLAGWLWPLTGCIADTESPIGFCVLPKSAVGPGNVCIRVLTRLYRPRSVARAAAQGLVASSTAEQGIIPSPYGQPSNDGLATSPAAVRERVPNDYMRYGERNSRNVLHVGMNGDSAIAKPSGQFRLTSLALSDAAKDVSKRLVIAVETTSSPQTK